MKKLTSLQVLMLMGLAINAYSVQAHEPEISDQEFQEQAVQLALQSEATEQANDAVLQNLALVSPATVEEILVEEADLATSFQKINNLIKAKNKRIEQLSKQKTVDSIEIAKLAVQLADLQAAHEKAVATQRAKHKKSHKLEESISDALKKAEQSLKTLNKRNLMKAVGEVENATRPFIEKAKNSVKSKKSKASKAVVKASAQQPMLEEDAMIDQAMNDAMMSDEIIV